MIKSTSWILCWRKTVSWRTKISVILFYNLKGVVRISYFNFSFLDLSRSFKIWVILALNKSGSGLLLFFKKFQNIMICDQVHITLTILFGLLDPILTNRRKQSCNNVQNDEIKLCVQYNLTIQWNYLSVIIYRKPWKQGLILLSEQTQIQVIGQTWK
jgi:hypothetical protein